MVIYVKACTNAYDIVGIRQVWVHEGSVQYNRNMYVGERIASVVQNWRHLWRVSMGCAVSADGVIIAIAKRAAIEGGDRAPRQCPAHGILGSSPRDSWGAHGLHRWDGVGIL